MAELWQSLIDNSGAVIGVFTIVLAVTTIVYVVVSARLLKQSKNAFLADMVLRVMETCRREIREVKEEKEGVLIKAWMKGYRETFPEIDRKLGMDLVKLIGVCFEAVLEEWKKGQKKLKEKAEKKKVKRK